MKLHQHSPILRGSCCRFLLLLVTCLYSYAMYAQDGTIRGRVLNEQGLGLEGATVSLDKGTTKTITGALGAFTLNFTGDRATLTITYLGYTSSKAEVARGKELIITLHPAVNLIDTVQLTVSTGYQQLSRERATGSFNVIGNALFNEQAGTSVISRLEAVAGAFSVDRVSVLPGKSGLMVRGMSTILGVRGPLIVVDNFPYEGSLDNINPNDVENITILKDAAAASIWGTRAGNGVIVITTKKAGFNQPVKTEFSSSVSIITPPDLFARPQMAISDLIDLEQMQYAKGFYAGSISSTSKPVLSPVVDILIQKTAGTLTAAQADAQINALRNQDVRNDFAKYMYSNGLNQQYALTVKGGSQNANWLFSTGVDRDKSELSATYNRLNLQLTNTFRPVKNLTAGAGIYFTESNTIAGKPAYGSIAPSDGDLAAYTRFADEKGKAVAVGKLYRTSYLQSLPASLLDWNYYPLTDYLHTDNTSVLRELTGNLNLDYRFAPWLTLGLKYQYERQQTDGSIMSDQDSYLSRSLVDQYSQINATTGAITYKVPKGAVLDLAGGLVNSQNARGQLNFSHSWKKNSLNAIAGAEIRDARSTTSSSRIYGYDPDILQVVNVDYTTVYPTLVSGVSSTIPGGTSFGGRDNRYVSGFANAAWTYLGRYTVSGSGRRDASNLFGVSTNDKWTPLWSAGAAWDIASEPFYHLAMLPRLKLRLTYGFSGNADPSRTAVSTASYRGPSIYTLQPIALIGQFGNPELKWERVSTLNFGLDFATSGNRVSGSLEYYRKKGDDLFGTIQLDYTGGADLTVVKNIAAMKGGGLDLELNSLNTTGKIKWSTRFDLGTTSDRITKNYVTSSTGRGVVNGISSTVAGVVGHPVYSLFSYSWAGLDPLTGDPRVNFKGQVSKDYTAITNTSTLDDVVYSGPSQPRIYGSVGNTVSIGPFSLSAAVIGKFKYYFRKTALSYTSLYSNRVSSPDYSLRWQSPGDEQHTNVPSMIYPAMSTRDEVYKGSSINIDKADQLRLQYVTASWQLSRSHSRWLPVKSLNVAFNAANLGLLWKANKDHIDPDYPKGLPPVHTYSLSLRTNL